MVGLIRKNPDVKLLAFKLISILFLAVIFSYVYLDHMTADLNEKLIQSNISTIGRLVTAHPELKDDIVSAYTKRVNAIQIKNGIEAAHEYGYDDKLPYKMIPVINNMRNNNVHFILFSCCLFFILVYIILYMDLRKIYRRIQEVTKGAEKIVEGDFNLRFSDEDEGDLSRLGYQFNQMAKRLELTMERLKNEKVLLKNIVSDISHQLKTPLSSLKAFNELLLDDEEIDKEMRITFLDKSREQLERMEWLIINLLKLARLEAHAVEFNKKVEDISVTLHNSIEELRVMWENKNIKCSVNEAGEIYVIHDSKWVHEAITNIIKNCVEHTAYGGKIDIQLQNSSVMASIVIKDSGEGISEEDLPHIFERFYRGKNSKNSNSTGIGLALAKSIIESHNGMISVISQVGRGSTFSITFSKI